MKVLGILLIVLVVLAVLYFLMIMPRMLHKPDTAPFKEWLYAHRGLHDNATEAPENSMAAFRKAVDAGFGIELDIQLTKDRIPVVFHDFTLKRVCGGEGKISDYTYEELQQFHLCDSVEKIPKFEDVLKMVDGPTRECTAWSPSTLWVCGGIGRNIRIWCEASCPMLF